MSIKYTDFYWQHGSSTSSEKSLAWLLNELKGYPQNEESVENYASKFQNKMFCPECHQARPELRTRNNSKPYLQAIRSAEHAENCTYRIPPMSKNEWDTFDENITQQQKEYLLQSAINQLLKRDIHLKDSAGLSSATNYNTKQHNVIVNTERKNRSIPKKSIHRITEISEDSSLLVYGKANLILSAESSNDTYARMHMRFDSSKESHLLDIRCSNLVYKYIAQAAKFLPTNLAENEIFQCKVIVAVLCMINVNKRGKYTYRNVTLNHSSYIKILKAEE